MTDHGSPEILLEEMVEQKHAEHDHTVANITSMKKRIEDILSEINAKQASIALIETRTDEKLTEINDLLRQTLVARDQTLLAHQEMQSTLTEIKATAVKNRRVEANIKKKLRRVFGAQREVADALLEIRSVQSNVSLQAADLHRLQVKTVHTQSNTKRLLFEAKVERNLSKSFLLDASRQLSKMSSTHAEIKIMQEQAAAKLLEVTEIQEQTETTQKETVVKLINVTLIQGETLRSQTLTRKIQKRAEVIFEDVKKTNSRTAVALEEIASLRGNLEERSSKINVLQIAVNATIADIAEKDAGLRKLQAQAVTSFKRADTLANQGHYLQMKTRRLQNRTEKMLENSIALREEAFFSQVEVQTVLDETTAIQSEIIKRQQLLHNAYNSTYALHSATSLKLNEISHFYARNKELKAKLQLVLGNMSIKVAEFDQLHNRSSTLHTKIRTEYENTMKLFAETKTSHRQMELLANGFKDTLATIRKSNLNSTAELHKVKWNVQSSLKSFLNSTNSTLLSAAKVQLESTALLAEARDIQRKTILMFDRNQILHRNISRIQEESNKQLSVIRSAQNITDINLSEAMRVLSAVKIKDVQLHERLSNVTSLLSQAFRIQDGIENKGQQADVRWNETALTCNRTEKALGNLSVLYRRVKAELNTVKSVQSETKERSNATASKLERILLLHENVLNLQSQVVAANDNMLMVADRTKNMVNVTISSATRAIDEKLHQIMRMKAEVQEENREFLGNQTKLFQLSADCQESLRLAGSRVVALRRELSAVKADATPMLLKVTAAITKAMKSLNHTENKIASFGSNFAKILAINEKRSVPALQKANHSIFARLSSTVRQITALQNQVNALKTLTRSNTLKVQQERLDTTRLFATVNVTQVNIKILQNDIVEKRSHVDALRTDIKDFQAESVKFMEKLKEDHVVCVNILKKQNQTQVNPNNRLLSKRKTSELGKINRTKDSWSTSNQVRSVGDFQTKLPKQLSENIENSKPAASGFNVDKYSTRAIDTEVIQSHSTRTVNRHSLLNSQSTLRSKVSSAPTASAVKDPSAQKGSGKTSIHSKAFSTSQDTLSAALQHEHPVTQCCNTATVSATPKTLITVFLIFLVGRFVL